MQKDLGLIGTVARFKPVHNGHAAMLESMCERADRVIIGLGSANRYNAKNPFTPQESREMIETILSPRFSNFSFIEVPDLDNGPRWREMVKGLYGNLHHFVVENDYVQSLLKDDYSLILPVTLVPVERRVPLSATMVRRAMAMAGPWESMVPLPVASYIKDRSLDARFRQEFGLATLALAGIEYFQEIQSVKAASLKAVNVKAASPNSETQDDGGSR